MTDVTNIAQPLTSAPATGAASPNTASQAGSDELQVFSDKMAELLTSQLFDLILSDMGN